MTALLVGRFQPFHLGHLSIIKKIIAENDRLIIGIGSPEANYRPVNPFTCSERIQMIEASLNAENIPREKYLIIPIRNINNYALWISHLELYVPPFEKVYIGSDIIKRLFLDHNKKVNTPYQIVDIDKEHDISSTMIRELVLKGGDWEKLVPPAVIEVMEKWDGINRFQEIQEIEK